MRIKIHNKGVAIILTISVLTAISVMGMSFLALLNRDQKTSTDLVESLAAESALESALNISIFEIQERLINNANYIYSVIESANPANSGIPESYLYFKSIIKTTNAKLCLYQNSPEFNNVFAKLKNKLGMTSAVQTDYDLIHAELRKNVYKKWDIKNLSEITKIYIAGVGDATKMKIYESLLNHITTYPSDKNKELSVNIIDYGKSAGAAGANDFTADKRDFAPTGDFNHLNNAKLKIISGQGLNEVRTIIGVDTVNKNKLLLDSAESWTVTPDANSFYRVYSYTLPINFNAASKELIEANFEVVETLCSNLITGITRGTYDNSSTSTILGKLYNLRVIQKILIKDFEDWALNYLENLTGYNSNIKSKMELIRIFDLNQPKAFYNSSTTNYDLYPIPIPFTFETNGYFDVELTAGMKRNPRTNKSLNKLNRIATVKVKGQYEQALREDFYNVTNQDWFSPSDWVPIRLLDDPKNWAPTNNTNFKPYWEFSGTNISPNVIPDSLKIGIWLDFAADSEGRGNDKIIYDGTNFVTGDQLHTLFSASEGTVSLSSGNLLVEGNGSPQSKVILNIPKDDFGDVSIMTELQDNNEAQVFRMSHPSYDILWYNAPIANHVFTDHTNNALGIDNLGNHYTYPPERYFTPSLYMYDASGNADITYQPEYGYDDAGDYDAYGATCSNPNATYTSQDSFSIIFGDEPNVNLGSGHFNSENPNPFSSYLNTFKLFTLISPNRDLIDVEVFDSTNTSIFATNFENSISATLNSVASSIATSNKIGFRRRFLTGYYDKAGSVNGQFSVKYLKVIPLSDGGTKLPSHESKFISFPDNTKNFNKIKVYYRIGLNEDVNFSSSWFASNNVYFKFKIDSNFSTCEYIDKDGNSQTFNQTFSDSSTVTIDDFDKISGSVTLNASSLQQIANDSNTIKFKYKLLIEGDNSNPTRTRAFLKSTIVIEKIEIIYETDDKVVAIYDNY